MKAAIDGFMQNILCKVTWNNYRMYAVI